MLSAVVVRFGVERVCGHCWRPAGENWWCLHAARVDVPVFFGAVGVVVVSSGCCLS